MENEKDISARIKQEINDKIHEPLLQMVSLARTIGERVMQNDDPVQDDVYFLSRVLLEKLEDLSDKLNSLAGGEGEYLVIPAKEFSVTEKEKIT